MHPNVIGAAESDEPKKEPPISPQNDDEKDDLELDVSSMKVVELKKHLRERQLDDQGLKKTLQMRLQKYIDEQKLKEENGLEHVSSNDEEVESVNDEAIEEEKSALSEEVEEVVREDDGIDKADVEMNDIENVHDSKNDSNFNAICDVSMAEEPSDKMATEPTKVAEEEPEPDVGDLEDDEVFDDSDNVEPMMVVPETSQEKPTKSPKRNLGKKILKATTKIFSPNRAKKSPKKAAKKLESAKREECGPSAHSDLIDEVLEEAVGVSKMAVAQPTSENEQHAQTVVTKGESPTMNHEETKDNLGELRSTTSTAASSVIQSLDKHDSDTVEPKEPPPISTPSVPPKFIKPFSSSTAQAKKKEMDEARKARLEKIRNKVSCQILFR